MFVIGLVLVVIGLPLATTPARAMRGAAGLRAIGLPAEPTSKQLRTWRAIGAVVTAVGLVAVVVALL